MTPYRKARFREIAREIVAKDRYNRKYGLSVDTAGAIANALERAYREGIRDGEHGPAPVVAQPDSGPMEWALIPPRPRDAFWTICLFTLSRGDRPASGGRLVPAITERGTSGWMLDLQERTYEKLFGDRTIAPLVRLGLIEAAADDPAHRVVSKRGEETWSQFVRRGGQYPDDLTNLQPQPTLALNPAHAQGVISPSAGTDPTMVGLLCGDCETLSEAEGKGREQQEAA